MEFMREGPRIDLDLSIYSEILNEKDELEEDDSICQLWQLMRDMLKFLEFAHILDVGVLLYWSRLD